MTELLELFKDNQNITVSELFDHVSKVFKKMRVVYLKTFLL